MNRTDKRMAVYVGKIMRAHRRANDITLDKLAIKLNVDPVTVGKYEKGRINVPLTRFAKWCRALKVDAGKLINEALKHIYRGG